MTDQATESHQPSPPMGVSSSEGLGPLPETTLAEVRNNFLNQSRLSETGAAYWGSNWYEVRKLYTAEQMRAYAAQERERWQADAARFQWLAERTAATGLERWVHPFQFLAEAVDERMKAGATSCD